MNLPADAATAQLRRNVYWILIVASAGMMIGRILAVDSVDMLGVEKQRLSQELASVRKTLEKQGLSPEDIKQELKLREEKWRDENRLRRPFLSANDRSRWCTVRALVEPEMRVEGFPYAIDKVITPLWDTIDKVKHDDHLYSSKPPLLATLMAGPYWVIHQATGATLATHPYAIGRFMLILVNVLPLVVCLWLLSRLVERLGTTDWGRVFAIAAAAFGTFLTTFAVVINNHLSAAVSATVAVYAAVRIWFDAERRWHYFALAGFFAAFAAADELPALSLFAALTAALLWRAPRQTLIAYVPAAMAVAVGFFGSNWAAHQSLKPPYMHRRAMVLEPVDKTLPPRVKEAVREAIAGGRGQALNDTRPEAVEKAIQTTVKNAIKGVIVEAVKHSGRVAVWETIEQPVKEAMSDAPEAFDKKEIEDVVKASVEEIDKETPRPDNWYDYAYDSRGRTVDSYWRSPKGIDAGERSLAVYALHALVGHHGVFSLTPVWILSLVGLVQWLANPGDRRLRELAILIAAVSLACLVFYVGMLGERDRNYGGMTSGFRWVFWLAPLWLLAMLPAVDVLAKRCWTRCLALLLLGVSALSASYPTWNPWTQPWLYDLFQWLGWISA